MDVFDFVRSMGQYGVQIVREPAKLQPQLRTCLPWTTVANGLCLALNRRYLEMALANPNISGVIVPDLLVPQALEGSCFIISAECPEQLFCEMHNRAIHTFGITSAHAAPCVAATATIHPTAVLAQNVVIGERAVIGPYAVIGENSIIGDDVWIGPHVVIGEDGLYSRIFPDGKKHINHWGGVRIGCRCRIAAQSIIARSIYFGEYTEVGEDVFLSFQVTIGHDCKLAPRSDISTHATFGGRTTLGADCWVGIAATLSNTVTVGDKASVMLGSVLIDNVPDKAEVSGNFAISHAKNLRNKAKLS
jgi:UDP-3-O-[3-hydroxymyristoyl] glucosamine N-acyltransferase